MTHEDSYDLRILQEEWGINFTTSTDKMKVVWQDIKILKVEKEKPLLSFIKLPIRTRTSRQSTWLALVKKQDLKLMQNQLVESSSSSSDDDAEVLADAEDEFRKDGNIETVDASISQRRVSARIEKANEKIVIEKNKKKDLTLREVFNVTMEQKYDLIVRKYEEQLSVNEKLNEELENLKRNIEKIKSVNVIKEQEDLKTSIIFNCNKDINETEGKKVLNKIATKLRVKQSDFNINWDDKSTESRRMKEMTNFFVLRPTRVTNTGKSKIDLAFTNNKNIEYQVTDSPKLSGHTWQKISHPYQVTGKKVYEYIRTINYTEQNCEL
ncbi:hypothetical protein HHI36_023703 [Cryptolaemus montrouzieri]|uniref:Uncharacterized protein n=1 Tax=Cryptolaemus montrouzieri TaxID=559131 RepID=A0ABD2PI30_9CUCU